VFVGAVEEHDGTLVPALVGRLDVSKFDRRSLDEPDATVERRVDVWRKPVELNEDRNLRTQQQPIAEYYH